MRPATLVTLALIVALAPVYSEAQAQEPIPVPAAPAELQGRQTNIVLRLSEDGTPSINHQSVPWSRLDAELRAIFGKRPEKILFIETTPSNHVEDVQRVAAAARKQEIQLYALFGAVPAK